MLRASMSQTLTLRLESYDKDAQRLVAAAQTLADERKHAEVEPLHLFFRLLERSDATHSAVRRAGVDPTDVLVEAEAQLRKMPRVAGSVAYLSTRILDLLTRSEGEAARTRSSVSVAHLFLACAQEPSGGIASVLRTCGLSGAVLRATFADEPSPSSTPSGNGVSALPRTGADPLAEWGIDLVARAERGELDPVIGRDEELRRMMQILARRFENNPLLVGESGIGKHSIVSAFAQRIARGDVPSLFQGKRIVEIDLGLLSAGTKLRSEADERMRALLGAARDSAGEVILFLPDLGQLVSDKTNQGAGQLLSSALGRGDVRSIALASPDGAKKAEDADRLLLSRFAPIAIEPPTADEAIEILRGIVGRYESSHGITISDQAIVASVRLAKRYVPSAMLPKAAGHDAARRVLDILTRHGGASFLCVIKDCGPAGKGMISFPMEGISIALDIPVRDQTQAMIDALNEQVLREGGRIYLTKDQFTRPEHFRAMEGERLTRFNEVRRKWDPNVRIKSAQSVRLMGD